MKCRQCGADMAATSAACAACGAATAPAAAAREPWRLPLLLTIVALYASLLYLPFLGSGRVLTPHEGMVTQPALRLLDDGQWIVPRYASGYWLDKPPLLNWVTAAFFAIGGGFSELGARLPAALSAIGLSLLATVLAARFFDRVTALLAGLIQASCVYMLLQGRLGEIDIPFSLLVGGAHAALAWRWGRGETRLSLPAGLAFHGLAALAVLAKGPVALVFLGMTTFAFCGVRRSILPLVAIFRTPAIVVFLVPTIAWHVAAWMVAGQEALDQWNYNYLQRASGSHHLGREPFWYYFAQVPWLMLPWTVALLIGAPLLWRQARRDGAWFERFLWCWFLGGFAFLTLTAFKHKHYSFPVLLPLSILAARVAAAHIAAVPRHAPRFYVGVFAVVAVVFMIVNVFVLPGRDPRRETVSFVRSEIGRLPPDATILVVGLAQHAAYPYIPRPCIYADTLTDVQTALAEAAGKPLWVLTLRQFVQPAREARIAFTEIAAEPARKRVPENETLVLLRPDHAASAPATTPATPP